VPSDKKGGFIIRYAFVETPLSLPVSLARTKSEKVNPLLIQSFRIMSLLVSRPIATSKGFPNTVVHSDNLSGVTYSGLVSAITFLTLPSASSRVSISLRVCRGISESSRKLPEVKILTIISSSRQRDIAYSNCFIRSSCDGAVCALS
jgi:hypothetical protein